LFRLFDRSLLFIGSRLYQATFSPLLTTSHHFSFSQWRHAYRASDTYASVKGIFLSCAIANCGAFSHISFNRL
jgi:putative component of membrane protein insertase Oxa1/YidC/SpoIIIJ protein YidD